MVNHYFKFKIGLFILTLGVITTLFYTSCQKPDPSPAGILTATLPYGPPGSTGSSGPTASFTASVNASSTQNFTPSKSSGGGTTTLKGTNTYYTITINFPTTTGPGHYFLNSAGFSATLYDGSNTYTCDATYGSGGLTIDSIPSGKYYGSFNFIGETASFASESANGNFSDL